MRQDVERQKVRLPRLLALRPLTIDGCWELRDAVESFYDRLVGLGPAGMHIEPAGSVLLIFQNDGPDLQVRLTHRPDIWANRARVVIEVPDLEAVRQRLETAAMEYQPIQGWSWPDQRIGLWDPSGNRIEIKRLWAR